MRHKGPVLIKAYVHRGREALNPNANQSINQSLREEHRLTLLKNCMVRKISGAKRKEGQETGENDILGSLIACIAHHVSQ